MSILVWSLAPYSSCKSIHLRNDRILINISKVVRKNDEVSIRYLLDRGANPNLGPPYNAPPPLAQTRPIHNCGWALNYAAAFSTLEVSLYCFPTVQI
jgi:hypothetical protein